MRKYVILVSLFWLTLFNIVSSSSAHLLQTMDYHFHDLIVFHSVYGNFLYMYPLISVSIC